MILANLSDSARYECMHPLFKQVFDYIRSNDLARVPAGRIELDGERLFINVVDTALIPVQSAKLEAHRRYIDIHVPLTQTELIGLAHISEVGESEAPFDEEGDCALYAYPRPVWVAVRPGEFLVVYPEDTHAPLVGEGSQRKLIVKVML